MRKITPLPYQNLGPRRRGVVLPLRAVEQHPEDDAGPQDGAAAQLVPEHHAADSEGQHLPRRHHDREDDRPELLDGVEDEELARRAREREREHVRQRRGIRREERQTQTHLARPQQVDGREEQREEVHAEHHLVLVHAIRLIYSILPLARERVAEHVDAQDQYTEYGITFHTRSVLLLRLLRQHEQSHAGRDPDGLDILDQGIVLLVEELSHQHHGDDFTGLEERLRRKGDIFETLVLGPARHDVAKRTGRELVERRARARLPQYIRLI